MVTTLDRRLNQRSRADKALLPTPRWSTDEIRYDVGGIMEGL
jgi:hypothetical protein